MNHLLPSIVIPSLLVCSWAVMTEDSKANAITAAEMGIKTDDAFTPEDRTRSIAVSSNSNGFTLAAYKKAPLSLYAVTYRGRRPFTRAEIQMSKNTINKLISKRVTLPSWANNLSEIAILARLVNAEAGGEPYLGKVAVAATVLARTKMPIYKRTPSGVILQAVEYQGKSYIQYSPVIDGRIDIYANQTCFDAVYDAMAGLDPSRGANGFYNPKKTTNKWVRDNPVTTVIGGHVFYKYNPDA